MNIFAIPSWYPSVDDPQGGIFTLEQLVALANGYPDANFGISTWGQLAEANLLWAKDHFHNLKKLANGLSSISSERALGENLWEYYTHAFTWTDKLLDGNINNIIRANEKNLLLYKKRVGNVSLLHAHTSFPGGFIAWKLAEKYRIPFIITEHMGPFPFACYLKQGKIMDKVLEPLRAANAVISVSPFAAQDLLEKTGIRAVLIPNLVDEKHFQPLSPPNADPQKPFTFFSLGRLVPEKGFPDLLQAISLMKAANVYVRIGGSGTHMQKFQELACKLGVAHKISWLGELNREQVAHEFTNCHAFVLASLYESMGVVFAEAIACGKPIITTRCGGPEFIVKPLNGLLVERNAPKQLADAMDSMIKNYSKFSQSEIREDFLNRFSSPIITKKIFQVYETILLQKDALENS